MKKKLLLSLLTLILIAGVGGFIYLTPQVNAQGGDDDFSKSFLKFREEKKNWERVRANFERNPASFKDQLNKGRKLALERAIEVMEKRLQQLEERVKNREKVYEGIAQELLNQIKANLESLNQIKTRLQSATTADELKAIAEELKTYRQKEKEVLRKLIVLAHIGQFENSLIKAAENRSQKIAQRIADLKNAGKDVAQLENLLNQANQKISQAKAKLQELRNQANSGVLDISNLSEIQNKLNEIKTLIKDAYSLFREIAIKGNELFGNKEND